MKRTALISLGAAGLLLAIQPCQLPAVPLSLHPDVQLRKLLDTGANTVRLARDPTDNILYYSKADGAIYRVDLDANPPAAARLYTPANHGVNSSLGFAIGPDGTFYLTGNRSQGGNNIASLVKGVVDPQTGERVWSTLARTEPYPLAGNNFDHLINGIAISPDNRFVYFNSGSRTDHGEVEDNQGKFPGLREAPLTSAILRVPVTGQDLVLPADEAALRAAGYLFADGVRNTFDLAFAADGDLFGTENGPDRDMNEELNWLREGHHYGFPWRMGTQDNPQQFPDYDPDKDLLLPAAFIAVRRGTYVNDPAFPPPPMAFTDPVINLGPHADSFRDPADGQVKDASDLGLTLGTFTAHRSPLGLVFDVEGALGNEFQGDAFMLSWTAGDPFGDSAAGPFKDPGEDLLHLELEKRGDNYAVRATRLISNFENPIDAELIGSRLYVVEYGGNRGLWEVSLPAAPTAVEEERARPAGFSLAQNFPNPFNAGTTIEYQTGHRGAVELAVFAATGQRVRTLFSGQQPAGHYAVQWDGMDARGQRAASGVYFCRLMAPQGQQVRRLALVQ